MWLLDRIDSWLNGRDIDKVEDELLVVDAANADQDKAFAAAKEASANEAEARRLIAQSKAHGREVDIAESDSDNWGPPGWQAPARRERLETEDDSPEDVMDGPQ